MIRVLIISLISNIHLLAENLKVDDSMPWMLPWLIGSLLMVMVMLWAMYKAVKTKNAKYGYVIAVSVIFLVGLMFI